MNAQLTALYILFGLHYYPGSSWHPVLDPTWPAQNPGWVSTKIVPVSNEWESAQTKPSRPRQAVVKSPIYCPCRCIFLSNLSSKNPKQVFIDWWCAIHNGKNIVIFHINHNWLWENITISCVMGKLILDKYCDIPLHLLLAQARGRSKKAFVLAASYNLRRLTAAFAGFRP